MRVLADRALLALQGPAAVTALSRLNTDVAKLVFMTGGWFNLDGIDTFLTRSWLHRRRRLRDLGRRRPGRRTGPQAAGPAGSQAHRLGARDTLRLEAGLCLYGHDIDTATTPVEAALTWAIQKVRRRWRTCRWLPLIAAVIDRQFAEGVSRKARGLISAERMPVREGAKVVDEAGNELGVVTSGLGPSVRTSLWPWPT